MKPWVCFGRAEPPLSMADPFLLCKLLRGAGGRHQMAFRADNGGPSFSGKAESHLLSLLAHCLPDENAPEVHLITPSHWFPPGARSRSHRRGQHRLHLCPLDPAPQLAALRPQVSPRLGLCHRKA